jgi:hypothetical protein
VLLVLDGGFKELGELESSFLVFQNKYDVSGGENSIQVQSKPELRNQDVMPLFIISFT